MDLEMKFCLIIGIISTVLFYGFIIVISIKDKKIEEHEETIEEIKKGRYI